MDTELQNRLINHVRINQLLARGNQTLQRIFRKRWIAFAKKEWSRGDGNEFVQLCSTASPGVKEVLTNSNIDSWDITAACYGILAISKEIRSKGGNTNVKEDKAISALRECRNNFVHGKSEYTNDEFNKKWNEIASYLVNLGDSHAAIKKLKADLMNLGKPKVFEDVLNEGDGSGQADDRSSYYETAAETVKSDNESEYESCESEAELPEADENKVESEPKKCNTCTDKTEATQFKEKGDQFLKAKEYVKAIEAYTEAIQFSGLQAEDQAHIFANRSAAHLMAKTKESFELAKRDAEWAIKLWPCWWKVEEVYEAEKTLKKAYALNPTSKEVRDELNAAKYKIGVITRADHLKPENQLPTEYSIVKTVHNHLGISKKQAKKLASKALNLPNSDILKATNYMLGIGGFEQNYTKAANFYERAALQGETEAMYNLGLLYQEGNGVKQDFDISMKWLMEAATADVSGYLQVPGDISHAQHTIAMRYHQGIGVPQDFKKAVYWYEKSLKNGYEGAASNLGMMYKNGEGVPRNSEKAFELFKFAAMAGDTQGMVNLSSCYLIGEGTGSVTVTDKDIAEGKKWLKIAADKGNLQAAQELKIRENYTKEHAILQAFGESILAGAENVSNPLNKQQYKKEVKEAARKGSTTAQRIVDIWKNLDDAMEAFKSNDSDGIITFLSKAIRIDPQIVNIPELFNSVIEKKIKESPDNLNAIICFVHINGENPEFPEIVRKYFSTYKENEYFLEMRISSFIGMNRCAEALGVADRALMLYPKSVRFLYCRAMALFSFGNNNADAIEAVDAFIDAVPKDNDKIPTCYYRKASHYNSVGNTKKFMESYEAGIAAEKKQLPCFLPYNYPQKHLLDRIYKHCKKELSEKEVAKNGKSKTPFIHTLEEFKFDTQRKLLLTRHRQAISQYTLCNNSKAHGKSPVTSDPPSLESLKKITIIEMNPCEDKPYNGYVLKAKIIDWALLAKSIVTVVEDENGDLQRLAINNWPSKGNKILDIIDTLKTFRPNTVISIINPHFRQSSDGKAAILVESPPHIQIDNTLAENKCCCCGKEAKVLPCSKCLMSRYCSKECQIFDWKEFNHNNVCEELKKYSQIL
uniref:MYND-type domain-containing protein n=1 Tax=Panagrolaimus sp. ES5 TaxID=591445 RepID=A0AC34F9Z3_9BILA